MSRVFIGVGNPSKCFGISRIQFESLLELLQCKVVFPSYIVNARERDVHGGKVVVEFGSFLAIGQRFVKPLRIRFQFIFQAVGS